MFLRHYFPQSVCEQKKQEFMFLKQGSRDLAQYYQEFNKLMRFELDQVSTENDRMKKFLNGMKLTLQKNLSTCEVETYGDLLDKALKRERAQK